MLDKNVSSAFSYLNVYMTMFMVLLHSGFDYQSFDSSAFNELGAMLMRFLECLYSIAVPIFFMISSFLLFQKIQYNKFINSFYEKIKKRIHSLLIPYALFSAFWMMVYLVVSILLPQLHLKTPYYSSLEVIFCDFILCKYDGPMWFVLDLFLFDCISPFMYFFIIKYKKSWIIYFILIFININIQPGYSSLMHWSPVFFLGGYFSVYYNRFILLRNKLRIILCKKTAIAVNVIAFIFITLYCSMFSPYSFVYYLYRIVGSTYAFLLFVSLWKKCNISPINYYTFWIFVLHAPLAHNLMKTCLSIFPSNSFAPCFMYYILTASIVFSVLLFSAWYMKNNCSYVYGICTGNRRLGQNIQ